MHAGLGAARLHHQHGLAAPAAVEGEIEEPPRRLQSLCIEADGLGARIVSHGTKKIADFEVALVAE